MKQIVLIERYCTKCKKYVDLFTFKQGEDKKYFGREEKCLICHTKITYAKAIYERIEK